MADAVVTFGYQDAAVRQGISALQSRMAGFQKTVGSLGAAIAAVGVGSKIKSVLEDYDRIGKLATRFNTTTEAIQRLDLATQLAGADLETAARALTLLNRALDDPANVVAAEAFQALGVDLERLRASTPWEQVRQLADAFQRAQATGQGFSPLMDLLGRSGAELIPLLRTATGEMDRLSRQPVATDAQIRQIEGLNDRMTELNQTLNVAVASALGGAVGLWQDVVKEATETALVVGEISAALLEGKSLQEASAAAQALVVGLRKEEAKEAAAVAAADERAAAAAEARADAVGGGDAGATGGGSAASTAAAAAQEALRVETLRHQIGEAQVERLLRHATLEGKAAILQQRMLQVEKEFQAVLDQGPVTESVRLEQEQKLLTLQEKMAGVQQEITAEKQAQLDLVRNQAQAQADIGGEIAVLALRASGREKEAVALERALRVQEEARRIMGETGLGQREALALAEQKAALEQRVAEREGQSMGGEMERGGRRRIQGVTREAAEASLARWRAGGLDRFYALQQRSEAGERSIPFGQAFAGQGAGPAEARLAEGASILELMQRSTVALEELAAV